jgi:exopolyphosphatase/guanosine-5'-triphosphate,3'-diphosphate pyrophosphatase
LVLRTSFRETGTVKWEECAEGPRLTANMRLGVLDVGSNTVHLLVVDAHPGARPVPAFSHKVDLRLAAQIKEGNRLPDQVAERLTQVVAEALRIAEDKGVEDFLAFATSAVRDAVNGDEVLARVEDRTGAHIRVLSGENEARLTFLAARRWCGWSSGRLLVLDIGGGSLEVAAGPDEEPEAVMSLPLGQGNADQAVGTSKTFRQLARIAGAAPSSEGFYVKRYLKHSDVSDWAERLADMTRAERARLPGVSEGRAPQMVAGAIVADAVMDLMDVERLEICPWALREGVILKRLDNLGRPPA